jgi:predicted O-methyltransferase YrrM
MKEVKNAIKHLANQLPYVKTLYKQSANCTHPNGHYYSPVFSIEDVKNRQDSIWKDVSKDGIPCIELRTNEQKQLVLQLSSYYHEMPFQAEKSAQLRYDFKNGYFSYSDGILLYSMIRQFQPKRIIEIGSGHSSALMLDTNELFFKNEIDLTFIEPYPAERLDWLMNTEDKKRFTVIPDFVQSVSLNVFAELGAGDILFIDSTHVSKTGSDVNYILFDVLPVLQPGVIIHFHDVFYPFEYPKEWVFNGYNWNEDYLLRAFLMCNSTYDILLFPDYLYMHHKEVFDSMPLCKLNTGGSFWIQKK